jgi:hypothetical protein
VQEYAYGRAVQRVIAAGSVRLKWHVPHGVFAAIRADATRFEFARGFDPPTRNSAVEKSGFFCLLIELVSGTICCRRFSKIPVAFRMHNTVLGFSKNAG